MGPWALGQPKTKLIQTNRQCSELGTSGSSRIDGRAVNYAARAKQWPSLL